MIREFAWNWMEALSEYCGLSYVLHIEHLVQVMCSLRNLAANQKDGLNKLRFWGKAGHGHTGLEGSKGRKLQVLGTEADYYVAEAATDTFDGAFCVWLQAGVGLCMSGQAQRDGGDEDPDPDADQPGLKLKLGLLRHVT